MKKILIKLAIIVLAGFIVIAIIELTSENIDIIKNESVDGYYDHYDRL